MEDVLISVDLKAESINRVLAGMKDLTESERKMILANGEVNQKLNESLGLIGKERAVLKDLYKERIKASSPEMAEKYNEAIRKQKAILDELRVGTVKLTGALELERQKLEQLRQAREKAASAGDASKITAQIAASQKRISEMEGQTKGAKNQVSGLIDTLKALPAVIAAAFVANKAIEFGKYIFEITAKYEGLKTTLLQTLGTQAATEQKFAELNDLAAKTSFSVEEVTNTFIKFANRGMEPTNEQLVNFGDIAASLGKPLDQLTEAMLDVPLGQYKRLVEFGIQANTKMVNGVEKLIMTFKGERQEVENTNKGVMQAFVAFGKLTGVMGSMESASKTLNGKMSTLNDNWEQMVAGIGNKLLPVFHALIDGSTEAVGAFSKLIGVQKTTQQQFSELSAGLNTTVAALARINQETKAGNLTAERENYLKKQKSDLIKELNVKYGEYLPFVLKEGMSMDIVAEAYRSANHLIQEHSKLKGAQAAFDEANKKQTDAFAKDATGQAQLSMDVQRVVELKAMGAQKTQIEFAELLYLTTFKIKNQSEALRTNADAFEQNAKMVAATQKILTHKSSNSEYLKKQAQDMEDYTKMAKVLKTKEIKNEKDRTKEIASLRSAADGDSSRGNIKAYNERIKDIQALTFETEKAQTDKIDGMDEINKFQIKLGAEHRKELQRIEKEGVTEEFALRSSANKNIADEQINSLDRELSAIITHHEKLKKEGKITGAEQKQFANKEIEVRQNLAQVSIQIREKQKIDEDRINAEMAKKGIDRDAAAKLIRLKLQLENREITQYQYEQKSLKIERDANEEKLELDKAFGLKQADDEKKTQDDKIKQTESDIKLRLQKEASFYDRKAELGTEAGQIEAEIYKRNEAIRQASSQKDFAKAASLLDQQSEAIYKTKQSHLKDVPNDGFISLPSLITQSQKALGFLDDYYMEKLARAKLNGEDTLQIERDYEEARAAAQIQAVEKATAMAQKGLGQVQQIYTDFSSFLDANQAQLFENQIGRSQVIIDKNNETLTVLQDAEKNATGRHKKELQAKIKNLQEANKHEQNEQKRAAEAKKETEKQALERQKVFQIASASIDLAATITKIWLAAASIDAITLGIGGTAFKIIQTALASASYVANVAKISGQKLSFGGVLSGPSHAQGGVQIVSNGKNVAEAEGGEIVLAKGVHSNPTLRSIASMINVEGGGKPFAPKLKNLQTLDKLAQQSAQQINVNMDVSELKNEIASLKKTIQNLPQNHFSFDKNGFERSVVENGIRTKILEDSYFPNH